MRIYVAGPIAESKENPNRLLNVMRGMDAGTELMKKGHSPFVPHLSHYLDLKSGRCFTWNDWLRIDFDFLAACDAILYLAPSPGADRELEYAQFLGLQVFYSIEEVPNAIGTPSRWGEFTGGRGHPAGAGAGDHVSTLH